MFCNYKLKYWDHFRSAKHLREHLRKNASPQLRNLTKNCASFTSNIYIEHNTPKQFVFFFSFVNDDIMWETKNFSFSQKIFLLRKSFHISFHCQFHLSRNEFEIIAEEINEWFTTIHFINNINALQKCTYHCIFAINIFYLLQPTASISSKIHFSPNFPIFYHWWAQKFLTEPISMRDDSCQYKLRLKIEHKSK